MVDTSTLENAFSNAEIDVNTVIQNIPTITAQSSQTSGESGNTPVVPENPEILEHSATDRFSAALWFDKVKEQCVTLIGAGGIGSHVALNLSRLDIRYLIIYDGDTVSIENMAGQLYCESSIGQKKSFALNRILYSFSNFYKTGIINYFYTDDNDASNLGKNVICAVDNMNTRKLVYSRWKDSVKGGNDGIFIDGRLAAEKLQIFCITADDTFSQERYEMEWLFSDAEADETPCSYKQTTFTAYLIGGLITNLFVNYCANQCNPLIKRDLPFFTSYDASLMFLKTTI